MDEQEGPAGPVQNVPAVMPPGMTDLAEQLVSAAAGQGHRSDWREWAADGSDSAGFQSALEVEMAHHQDYASPSTSCREEPQHIMIGPVSAATESWMQVVPGRCPHGPITRIGAD